MLKTSDLKTKQVVNMSDGKKLGSITDIEIDLDNGRIQAIVVPGPARLRGLLGRGEDIIIPWEKIHTLGIDVILVEAGNYFEQNTRKTRT